MKKLFLTAAAALALTAAAAQSYEPSAEIKKAQQEFQDQKFGIFLHWGIYSMMGQGEWVMHNRNINYQEYRHLADGFYPSKFNADEWVEAFKDAGAKYVTFTTRHHDSFSMFKTAASTYNIVDGTPYAHDVLADLANACHKQGLSLHLYYSHLDWQRPDYPLLPPLYLQVHSLHLRLHSFPENRFINNIFIDSIDMH